MEAILPCYLQQIQSPSYIYTINNPENKVEGKSEGKVETKTERDIILQLAVAVRTMVHNSEGLAK